MFPDVPSKPSLVLFWAIPTSLIPGEKGEEISNSFFTSPPWKAVRSNEVSLPSSPQPSFLLNRKMQSLQLLLTGCFFQAPHQLCFHSLDVTEYLHILVELWGPELPTALPIRLHQCWVKQEIHLFWLAGDAVFETAWDRFCPLGYQGTYGWHTLSLTPTSSPRSLSALLSQCNLVPGITPS